MGQEELQPAQAGHSLDQELEHVAEADLVEPIHGEDSPRAPAPISSRPVLRSQRCSEDEHMGELARLQPPLPGRADAAGAQSRRYIRSQIKFNKTIP